MSMSDICRLSGTISAIVLIANMPIAERSFAHARKTAPRPAGHAGQATAAPVRQDPPPLRPTTGQTVYSPASHGLTALYYDAFLHHFPAGDSGLPGDWGGDRSAIIEQEFGATPAPPRHLLRDQAAPVRMFLLRHGVNIQLSYKTETLWNVAGGIERGGDYAHEVALQVDTDLGRLTHMAPLSGWTTHLAIIQRAGRSVTHDRVGERAVNLAEAYGTGGNVLAHMVYFYAEKQVLDNRLNVAMGRMPVTLSFASSPIYCTFMTICASPMAFKGTPGNSVWPNSTWGGRIRLRPALDNFLVLGAYQVNPNYGGISGWSWFNRGSTGAFLPIEDTWRPYFGRHGLVGHYKVGYAYNSSDYPDLLGPAPRGTLPPSDRQGIRGSRPGHRHTVWYMADQMLWRTGRTETSGGILFGGFVYNSASISVFHEQEFIGLMMPGLVPARAGDRVGLLLSHYTFSPALRRGEELREDAGMRPGANLKGPQSDENVLEVYYGAAIMRGILFQPEYEYVVHPGGTTHIRNAHVIGFKLTALL
ncbi:carbohydrate-selective porin OprB [Gluconacetobacter sacchari DSM 12717]|uniref:Carbohydrate porin n=2 Tax=Gluconacetobacter sacchari TaxID=92759 RepID=A0A7W4IAN3_9PROT|nr:carbohydrate porin [Gluconacetobacter sacchari]MBB2159292.1 carbohydrate porin [Gluconacetobacter sacchari]GBQ26758.1 carbohydrate-selective porin OprB [Gluconacetobacter sacchari DSM 12717]